MPAAIQTASPSLLQAVGSDLAMAVTPVRQDLTDAHVLVLTRLAHAGQWWTGAERLAIAAEARTARGCPLCAERKEAISPAMVTGNHQRAEGMEDLLPENIVDPVHFVINDSARMTPDRLGDAIGGTITEAHLVEAIGIAFAVRSMDQTCRGLGTPFHALPAPVAGEPGRTLPAGLTTGEAFVAMLPGEQPPPPNDDLRGDVTACGLQALSAVPDAVRDLLTLAAAQYVPMDIAFDMTKGRTMGREQMELLAGRVSAINDCFY